MRVWLALFVLMSASVSAGTLTVATVSPARHSGNATINAPIVVTFNLPVNPATVTISSFRAYARWSGPLRGTFEFSNGNQTVTLVPNRALSSGETVTVNLANTIAAQDGSPLRAAGYAWQFVTRTGTAQRILDLNDTVSVRINNVPTRLYGGFAADIDHDGWLDLAGVNEVSHDLRILFNRDDGTGLVQPVFQPVTPIGVEASPNEPGDFNNDGEIDAAVVNSTDSTVSVVLGNGNGTFQPQVTYATGSGPHGIAMLDVDGDADWDMVTTAQSGNNLRLRLSNGNGTFASTVTNFDGGGNGEWPLGAGDMNNDGILDLVVGTTNSAQTSVLLGNGNGTFAAPVSVASGGFTWMLALGDVNGDGNLDVAMANGPTGNGAIMLGNGLGGLGAATITNTGGTAIASDLGDLDGDGDLDWAISNFASSRVHFYRNNGNGTFTFDQDVLAPQAGSCSIFYDADNDTDLDVAIFDELADTVQLLRNRGSPVVELFANGFE
jgi:hypothetical protein